MEFLRLLPPDEARRQLISNLGAGPRSETIAASAALGRVTAEDVVAPHGLPEFARSTVDGYAVHSRDTFGASDSLPAYLRLAGEVLMGAAPGLTPRQGECALIHTGGMLPEAVDAVVMLEHAQLVRGGQEVEILRAVADGENVIRAGEDVAPGQVVIPKGRRLRPAEVGGLAALGILALRVAAKPRVGVISSGDEVVPPDRRPHPGQVRDVNSYTLSAVVSGVGGEPVLYGIVPDDPAALKSAAERALAECDVVVITAGSSASTRDLTADVVSALGKPGVLVHGINTRPGKPTILGVCSGKAVIGLPGNPVSALVNGYLFLQPVIEQLLGLPPEDWRPSVRGRLAVNLASQAGREDWWPVKLRPEGAARDSGEGMLVEPIFGKSNLIFNMVRAEGLIRIPPDVTGLSAGEIVEVFLL